METINSRIAALIHESGKTKTEWASRLNVTPQFVSSLCNGKKSPSDRTIGDICRVSGVREEWLRNGEGPVYPEKELEPLDRLLKDQGILQGDIPSMKSVVSAFLELEKPSRDAVIQFVQSCAEKLNAPTDDVPGTDAALAEKVAALERQNRELMARLEAIEKEDAEKETAGAETGAAYISRYR